METKHYFLMHGWHYAYSDRKTLDNWTKGIISTQRAIYEIRKNNQNEAMFPTEQDFIDWAESLGWWKE